MSQIHFWFLNLSWVSYKSKKLQPASCADVACHGGAYVSIELIYQSHIKTSKNIFFILSFFIYFFKMKNIIFSSFSSLFKFHFFLCVWHVEPTDTLPSPCHDTSSHGAGWSLFGPMWHSWHVRDLQIHFESLGTYKTYPYRFKNRPYTSLTIFFT